MSRAALLTFILVLLLLCLPLLGHAATFNVNSFADAVDATPGNGICATAGGVCTLRAAIQEANALAGADTISLPAGTYTTTRTGTGENAAATGDLDINDTAGLTLIGSGKGSTIINGGALDRVFDIFTGATTTMSDLTITNGKPGNIAGAIYVQGAGTQLTLTHVSITGNDATGSQGGAINNFRLRRQRHQLENPYDRQHERWGGFYAEIQGEGEIVELSEYSI